MKIPFLPAALLTMAAILVGCTKEQNPPETMDLGKPFVVHVLNNGKGTRGQAITAVSSFNMVGIQGASNKWMDNLLFTNPGDGTPVSLLFKHALSSVKFKIGFDKDARGGENDLHIHVTRLTLHHIATKGSFDFANFVTNPWSVDAEDAGYKDIVINLKTPVDFKPSAVTDFITLDDNIDGEIYVLPHKPTPWDTDGTFGHPLNNSYIGVTCQIVEYRTKDTPTYYDLAGLDEDSDEDDYDEAKELYINFYEGYASTDNDDWLNDKVLGMIVPTDDDWSRNVVLQSILDHRNEEAAANGTEDNVEEVFIPLEMTNGFGFNKTNVINVRMDKMKYSNGKDFYVPFVPIITPVP